jgi:predicted transcriptional regulator
MNEGKLERTRPEWTEENEAKLIELRNNKKSHKEIAVEMNKSVSCISQHISKLLQEGKLQKQTSSTNDDELIAYIKEFYHTSSMKEIGDTLDLTANAIYARLKKKIGQNWKEVLGLNKPKKLPKPKKCKKEHIKLIPEKGKERKFKSWTEHDIKILFSDKTMDQIAEKLGRTKNSCYVKKFELKHKKKGRK